MLFDHTCLSTSNYFNHLVYSSMRTTTISLKPIIQMRNRCSFHVLLVDINMDAVNLLETEVMEWNCSHHYFKLKCEWLVCTEVMRLLYLKHENNGCQISNNNKILCTWKPFFLKSLTCIIFRKPLYFPLVASVLNFISKFWNKKPFLQNRGCVFLLSCATIN